jgi:hypothetical protein
MRLTLQQMIDKVMEGAQPNAMAKLAEEANGGEGDKPPQKKGEGYDKKDVERKADSEEAQQGGGTPEAMADKTASIRVQKLASAVDEIITFLAAKPAPVGRVVTAADTSPSVDAGKGPGATQTNLESPVTGEQSDVSGEAKTKIPTSPPTEKGDSPKSAPTAMATNVDMQHPAQPDTGVLKQSSLRPSPRRPLLVGAEFSPEEQQRIQDTARSWAGFGGGVPRAVLGGAMGGAAGHKLLGQAGVPIGALLGIAGGYTLGSSAGERLTLPQAEQLAAGKKTTIESRALDLLGTSGLGRAAAAHEARKILKDRARAKEASASAGDAPSVAAYTASLLKRAEDAISPAQISASKSTVLPEDQPSQMARPAEVTSQEKLVASNEAVPDATKEDAKDVPKKRMGEVLSEPAQTPATDKVLDEALGAKTVDDAGAKVASSKVKAAAARAWLAKVASEGCTCGSPKIEDCRFCKVAAHVKRHGGSEKKGQGLAGPQSGPASAPGGALAGGSITPQM